jgi:hypothetical protein
MKKINSTIPEEMKEEFGAALGGCVEQFGTALDPKDPSCISYGPLMQCITVKIVEVK